MLVLSKRTFIRIMPIIAFITIAMAAIPILMGEMEALPPLAAFIFSLSVILLIAVTDAKKEFKQRFLLLGMVACLLSDATASDFFAGRDTTWNFLMLYVLFSVLFIAAIYIAARFLQIGCLLKQEAAGKQISDELPDQFAGLSAAEKGKIGNRYLYPALAAALVFAALAMCRGDILDTILRRLSF